MKTSHIWPTPLFLNFVQPPPPMLFLLFCFFDWMGDYATFDLLFHSILWAYTCQAMVTQYQKELDVCFTQKGVKFTEVWHMWFFAGTLI